MSEVVLVKDETQARVVTAVLAERVVQDQIWGGRIHDEDHTQEEWHDLLQERVTKVSKALTATGDNLYRRHLIELAALAIAALEVEDGNT
jgi:hypothetical protein